MSLYNMLQKSSNTLFSSNAVVHWSCEATDRNYNAVAVLCQLSTMSTFSTVAGSVDAGTWQLSFADVDAASQTQTQNSGSAEFCVL